MTDSLPLCPVCLDDGQPCDSADHPRYELPVGTRVMHTNGDLGTVVAGVEVDGEDVWVTVAFDGDEVERRHPSTVRPVPDFAADYVAARVASRTADNLRVAAIHEAAADRIARDARRAGVELDVLALDEDARARVFRTFSATDLERSLRDPSTRSAARAELARRAAVPSLLSSEDEFLEGLSAVHEGRATDLMRCYLCADEPLRGVVSMRVVDRADPTEAYTLTCGHVVI